MICPLCKVREGNKLNTHYLTDSIIRTALNSQGSNVRERGFYFTVDTRNPFFSFNFQRGTPINEVENILGRSANEQEVAEARKRLYSVDNVFCSDCECRFTEIETAFVVDVLPAFRDRDLTGTNVVTVNSSRVARTFFYVQLWRSAICEDIFVLSDNTMERLRTDILGYREGTGPTMFPIAVTYLQTLGGAFQFTNNLVGYTDDVAPRLILMNDFIVQFFEENRQVRFFDFYGLNSEADYFQRLNGEAERFQVKVLSDEQRLKLSSSILKGEVVKDRIKIFGDQFVEAFRWLFGLLPPQTLIVRFIRDLVDDNGDLLRYTRNGVGNSIMRFLIREFPNRFPR